MTHPMRKSTSRRFVLAATFLATAAVSLSALAYWPWEQISVTSHYDSNGSLVGVEAVGACGFPLVGETGAGSSQRMYRCDQVDQIEMPF
ncbi:MAG: hypothetical protein HOP03_00485 [Lysobacter sp.]|nr:hypothetical protein [Lysobacter sp.]